MEKHCSHFSCSKIHFVLLRNNEEALELVRNILREVAAEREALSRVATPCPSGQGWLLPRRHPHGCVDQRRLQGNSEGWQNLPSGTVLSLTLLARNLWETRIFLGSVFHGHGWVAALNDSEKFSLWVSWYNYTVSMGRKTYRLKLNSLSPKMFNTIYSFNGFPPSMLSVWQSFIIWILLPLNLVFWTSTVHTGCQIHVCTDTWDVTVKMHVELGYIFTHIHSYKNMYL